MVEAIFLVLNWNFGQIQSRARARPPDVSRTMKIVSRRSKFKMKGSHDLLNDTCQTSFPSFFQVALPRWWGKTRNLECREDSLHEIRFQRDAHWCSLCSLLTCAVIPLHILVVREA
ncbi:hypothetical protein AVEN_133818-1 [Araneus ventricosus]|uniref:Uncharacterized protein n=1 Tax=Araneus ventricosus TaxID=182803 RepID=A0A4Y2QZU3_ARAVE|nr:hypothetical protein AVEN_133818-1 [Araneus ventricosus]